ncbi:inorganic phosphate transporter, partial [Paraburkholderia sp. SIMBA_009]
MNQPASPAAHHPGSTERARRAGYAVFLLVLSVGAVYIATHLIADLAPVREGSLFPYL